MNEIIKKTQTSVVIKPTFLLCLETVFYLSKILAKIEPMQQKDFVFITKNSSNYLFIYLTPKINQMIKLELLDLCH